MRARGEQKRRERAETREAGSAANTRALRGAGG